jgi:uncharacterized protein (DUF2141 family)
MFRFPGKPLTSPVKTAVAALLTAALMLPAVSQAEDAEDRVARTLAKANPPDQVAVCSEQPRHIRILVEDVRDQGGVITADLHDGDPDSWLVSKKRVDRERWRAEPGTTEICFTVARPGTYAVALYHDLDASGKLNKGGLGIPSEPFGISNDPTIVLSPPSHAEAAFQVPEGGISLTITLKHGFRSSPADRQDR